MASAESVILDLNDLSAGGVKLDAFTKTVEALETAPYRDKHVTIKGCAPSWAHLMVAGKLFPIVAGLDFLLDDGKGGRPIPVFRR